MFTNWKKSSHSSGGDNCVEMAHESELIAVRNSKFPRLGTALFTEDEWKAFVAGVKDGEFDL